jgi:hypothetical protein
MTRLPIYDATVPVVCTASSDEIPARLATIEQLRSKLRSLNRTPHGLVLHFPPDDATTAEVRQFTVDEQACCRFWGFEVHASYDETTLRWDGPPRVVAFFDELVRFLDGDEPAASFPGFL